jgi:ethanolamine permease
MTPTPSSSTSTTLQKTLGPLTIWGLGVGYVISGSYFGWNYGLEAGGPFGLLAALAVATLLYVTFVLGYAELSCALPRAGGAFVYAERAFGPKAGFVVGLAQVVEYTLAPPAIAFSIGSYMETGFGLPAFAVALLAYVVFTGMNAWGVSLSVGFELVVTVVAVVELLVFGAVVLPSFSWATFAADGLPHGFAGAFFALPYALWFYLAIEGIANIAEEAKNPQRDLPRGFLSAMATLVVLAHVALLGSVGVAGWRAVLFQNGIDGATSDSPLPLAIRHVVGAGHPLFTILTGIGLLGLIASFHGILLASSRAILEMGRCGFLPRALGVLHPTRRTPVAALGANFAVGVLALSTGKTGDIILLSIFGALTLYLASTVALFRLRRLEPDLVRPYRTPGYPVVPGLALALTLIAFAAMIVTKPFLFGLYVSLCVGGYGAWRLWLRFSPAATTTATTASPPS